MKSLKKIPPPTKLITVKPVYLTLQDACSYTGMAKDLFRKVSNEAGISLYAYGLKKIWYKVSELDAMIEGLQIRKSITA